MRGCFDILGHILVSLVVGRQCQWVSLRRGAKKSYSEEDTPSLQERMTQLCISVLPKLRKTSLEYAKTFCSHYLTEIVINPE